MALPISHDTAGCRFWTEVDGHRGVLDYRLCGERMAIVHTGVPEAIGGRGIAAALMRHAADAARENGWRIVPECSYAAAWFERHAGQRHLLA